MQDEIDALFEEVDDKLRTIAGKAREGAFRERFTTFDAAFMLAYKRLRKRIDTQIKILELEYDIYTLEAELRKPITRL